MPFNSMAFLFFLPTVFILYWSVCRKSSILQNILLSAASLFFYGWTDWRFLSIIVFSGLFNYALGIRIADVKKVQSKKQLLWLGILVNIGILGYYKYFNFFYNSFFSLFHSSGTNFVSTALFIGLPLGLSFFTFQTIGYLSDIYNEELNPNRDLLVFITYVTFFPKLFAGPIERAQKFIPQVEKRRVFDFDIATNGLQQILWGFYKKIVVADNCAFIANQVFDNYQNQSASTLVMGSFFYTIQLYADFSGYSDIAIGVSKLFGIRLSKNFNFPFFATSISDFWRRWHISLSSWMMDYVFTPLTFILRRYQRSGIILAIIVTFTMVGLWHGANWTYIVFGLLNGCYFIPQIIRRTMNKCTNDVDGRSHPGMSEILNMIRTFLAVMFTMILFRSPSIHYAFDYYKKLISSSLISVPQITREIASGSIMAVSLFVIEYLLCFKKKQSHSILYKVHTSAIAFAVFIVLILLLMNTKDSVVFIYFQY